ncbi:hypothetical protein CCR94_13830 [Rhodoblastus sphagnicola]|uniref:Uncharacterized protein n=1 Tax=Rhodoblastus sphagnicola TaxID=333368 RepID=A0A2S6N545_9HYPH|nr:hypothetical protein [Rhodoblastus sphagnicola]MBB4197113.1 hypothetical protein [Rhodoblastus sphagnicola]PPQ29736.1 hypothetical protein CCR94_13830 [Rhodoblastus sphagnicola]
MSIRLQISILVYVMVQAVVFGAGVVLVLATPLSAFAMHLMPWVVGVSAIASAPVSWWIAPRMRSRFQRQTASQLPAE